MVEFNARWESKGEVYLKAACQRSIAVAGYEGRIALLEALPVLKQSVRIQKVPSISIAHPP